MILRDRTWYLVSNSGPSYHGRTWFAFFFLFVAAARRRYRIRAVGLSFVELRRERGAHPSDRGALKIALQGALFIPRDSWKRQIALYVRVRCATVVHSRSRARGKVYCPFSREEEYAYIASEASRGNINVLSLNLIFCTMLHRGCDKTIDITFKNKLIQATWWAVSETKKRPDLFRDSLRNSHIRDRHLGIGRVTCVFRYRLWLTITVEGGETVSPLSQE